MNAPEETEGLKTLSAGVTARISAPVENTAAPVKQVVSSAGGRPEPDLADRDTSDDDEDGVPRPKRGSGNVGYGRPMPARWGGKHREFHDGAGLCSPGRWPPPLRRTTK